MPLPPLENGQRFGGEGRGGASILFRWIGGLVQDIQRTLHLLGLDTDCCGCIHRVAFACKPPKAEVGGTCKWLLTLQSR